MSGEGLTVMLLTAHRLEYAVRTAMSTADRLIHDGPVYWHIADDGDDDNYIGTISDAIRMGRAVKTEEITYSQSDGRGYGANYNVATQVVHTRGRFVLPLEDDWELVRELDTRPIIEVLHDGGAGRADQVESPDSAECVRLGYLGFRYPLMGNFFQHGDHTWVMLDDGSEEQHVAAGHPRIETIDYERRVGPWAEGLSPGATELEWCGRHGARRGVVWPIDLVRTWGDLFAHIGTVPSSPRG